jgi:hypothetical protein
MGKVVNITDKLSFDEAPVIVVREEKLKVNADAATVLKIMGILGDGKNVGPKQVVDMYSLIFGQDEQEKIDKMKLSFRDFRTVVEAAINLIVGNDEDDTGEAQTHTTI